jgi:hypothetical protein
VDFLDGTVLHAPNPEDLGWGVRVNEHVCTTASSGMEEEWALVVRGVGWVWVWVGVKGEARDVQEGRGGSPLAVVASEQHTRSCPE